MGLLGNWMDNVMKWQDDTLITADVPFPIYIRKLESTGSWGLYRADVSEGRMSVKEPFLGALLASGLISAEDLQ